MQRIFGAINGLSTIMYYIAGAGLVFIMFLTVSDVVLRVFNRPITGVYDLTMLTGGVVIGFAIPFSTWKKAHVYMDFLVGSVSPGWRKVLTAVTRFLGIILFLMFGWNLILYGIKFYKVNQVSQTIHLPLYPVVLGIGVSCLINCLVLLQGLIAALRREEKA